MTQAPIVYQSGTNVKLIHKAEYCKSIIADGKELITGDEYGEIRVPELKDPKVYITFKEGITNFSDAFYGCLALKSIPDQLFANNTEVTNFSGTFAEGTALISIPAGLFDNNRKVSDFSYTFYGCSALTGESPYTMIGDQKVHIYERNNYLYIFSKIENRTGTFSGCNGLTDLQSNSIWLEIIIYFSQWQLSAIGSLTL